MSTGGLRKRRTHRFVQIPSSTIRDKRLSFRARGILAYLLDMPDGWDVKSEFLASQGKEGREAVRTGLGELAVCGYYRLERRQLRDGTFQMGTAISEEPVESWAAESAEFSGKAVPCIEQEDGSFKVRHKDGTLTDDGFEAVAVDGNDGPDDDGPPAGSTEDGFSGSGIPGSGSPDSGAPDSGSPGPISKKDTRDSHVTTSWSEPADAATDRDQSEDEPEAPVSQPEAQATPAEPEQKRLYEVEQPDGTFKVRDDVERVCQHLLERLIAQDIRPVPSVGHTWRNTARLMLDNDGRTEKQVHNMIDWATNHEFWRAHVQSMAKLREKYDAMRIQALAATQRPGGRAPAYSDERTWGDVQQRGYDPEESARAFGLEPEPQRQHHPQAG